MAPFSLSRYAFRLRSIAGARHDACGEIARSLMLRHLCLAGRRRENTNDTKRLSRASAACKACRAAGDIVTTARPAAAQFLPPRSC
jgi:hypothetical protein